MVQNWQLHCHNFENLDFAKYLADFSVPLGDSENLDDSKYLNSAKTVFHNNPDFLQNYRLDLLKILICEIFCISQVSQNLCFVKLI